jgi:hypothetical protein
MLRAASTSRFQKLALQALLAQRITFLFFRSSNSLSSLVASRRAFSRVLRTQLAGLVLVHRHHGRPFLEGSSETLDRRAWVILDSCSVAPIPVSNAHL